MGLLKADCHYSRHIIPDVDEPAGVPPDRNRDVQTRGLVSEVHKLQRLALGVVIQDYSWELVLFVVSSVVILSFVHTLIRPRLRDLL